MKKNEQRPSLEEPQGCGTPTLDFLGGSQPSRAQKSGHLQAKSVSQLSWRQLGLNLSPRLLAVLLFVACALIYGVSPQGNPQADLLQWGEITRTALNLAQRGTFADPFQAMPTGPTAHTAPAYVLLFAAVAKLFGTGRAGATVLWALNIGFLGLQLALLPILSECLGLGVLPGVLAAVLAVVIQPYRILIQWESIFTGALLVVLCILTVECFRVPRDWRHSALLGFVWGIAILTNPQCVLLLLVWPYIAADGNSGARWRKTSRVLLVVLGGAAVTCVPWFVRNYQRFDAIFFIRDNFGVELFTSNNSCAGPTTSANIASGCHMQTHPNPNPEIAGEIIDKGEVQFNRDRLRQALAWIASNPRSFACLTAQRFVRYWFPYLGGYRYAIPTGIATALSLVGLALMFRSQRSAFWMLSSTLLVYPLVHYIVQFEARYRYPIFWVTFVPAAYAILEMIRWLQGVRAPHVEPAALQAVASDTVTRSTAAE